MDTGLLVVLLVGPLVMALIAGLSWAAGTGRLRRNHAVGIRLPSTLASDAGWRAGHRAAVVPAACSLLLLVAADVAAVLLDADRGLRDALPSALTALLVLTGVWVVLACVRAARAADG